MFRYADFMAFFDEPGKVPRFDKQIWALGGIFHVTVAPPIPGEKQTYENINSSASLSMTLLRSCGDLVLSQIDLLHQNIPGFLCGLQHPPIDGGLADLYAKGIRITTIAYGDRNVFGSGFVDPDGPLTDSGREFVRSCADCNMILDLAHAGHRTARDILDFVDHEDLHIDIVASHTGCYAIFPHKRNLPDDILKRIAERGGVVGIYNITFLLDSAHNGIDPYLKHVDHALAVCGEGGVVVGTDGVYKTVERHSLQAKSAFATMKAIFDTDGRLGMRLPPEPDVLNTPFKRERLYAILHHAFGGEIADDLIGGNLVNFLEKALPV